MDRISATDLNNMLQKLYPIIKCGHIQPEEYDLVERAISLFSSTTPTCLADSCWKQVAEAIDRLLKQRCQILTQFCFRL